MIEQQINFDLVLLHCQDVARCGGAFPGPPGGPFPGSWHGLDFPPLFERRSWHRENVTDLIYLAILAVLWSCFTGSLIGDEVLHSVPNGSQYP